LAEQVFLDKATLVATRQILSSTLAQAAAARVQSEQIRAARTVLQQAALLATAEMVRHSHQMERHTLAVEVVETSIRPECLVLVELAEVEMANVDPPHRPSTEPSIRGEVVVAHSILAQMGEAES
jgi:predicted nucleic-acid-binding protein